MFIAIPLPVAVLSKANVNGRKQVSARYLELTRRKLELARLPHEPKIPPNRHWENGTPKVILEPLLDFW
jgi:hypothetical protein